jgi:hypothetical protein
MARLSNDKIERRYFEKFRQVYQLPDGIVVYGDKPDVKIVGARKIGVEMTSFFLKSGSLFDSEQRQRPLRAKIVNQAQTLYRAAGGKNIEVTFSFDGNTPITTSRMKLIPNELALLAHSMDSGKSGEILRYLFRDTTPEVWSIWVNTKEYSNAEWQLLGTHCPNLMAVDGLEAIVREKETKSNEYEQCDAYWLLVVVDGMDAAQEQEIRIDDPYVTSSVFEKIIIYEPLFGHVVEAK